MNLGAYNLFLGLFQYLDGIHFVRIFLNLILVLTPYLLLVHF
jgi:hypothetical protein